MASPAPIITRFAPSPTGYLHVGGARTALFCWLLARSSPGGRFLLRIEDTDLARSTPEACRQLLDDLRWLGLHWDNDPIPFQSQRTGLYNRIIDDLLDRGLAYRAWETPEELEAMRKAAELRRAAFVYRRRDVSPEQVKQYQAEGRPHVIRLAMPVREYRFRDEVLDKEIVLPAAEAQDFVIRKADGMPTYHFAVVVDDAGMGITHILRGQEHLKNTFYHIALQEALGYRRPLYAHLPIILNVDGSKMGKRDRDGKIRQATHLWLRNHGGKPTALAQESNIDENRLAEWLKDPHRQLDLAEQRAVMDVIGLRDSDLPEVLVHDFRRNGYLPEVLLNFLALLGWNPGGDRERMTMDEMVSLFLLQDVGKANAKFDRQKLLAFNTEAVAAATSQRLLAGFRDYLAANPQSPLNSATDEQLARLLEMKKGFRLFREVDELARFFYIADDQVVYDADAVEKVLRKQEGQGITVLRELRDILANTEWTEQRLEAAVQEYCQRKGLGLGKVAQPLRVAISGTALSPPIFPSLHFLGRQSAMNRIDRCLATV